MHIQLQRKTWRQKSSFPRPRRICETNIKIDIKETGCEDVDWIHQGPGKAPVACTYEYGNEPSGFVKVHWTFL
jgi:hypothetical protein